MIESPEAFARAAHRRPRCTPSRSRRVIVRQVPRYLPRTVHRIQRSYLTFRTVRSSPDDIKPALQRGLCTEGKRATERLRPRGRRRRATGRAGSRPAGAHEVDACLRTVSRSFPLNDHTGPRPCDPKTPTGPWNRRPPDATVGQPANLTPRSRSETGFKITKVHPGTEPATPVNNQG